MLMIDCVELVLANQPLKMRKLQGDHSVRSQQMGHASRKVVEVRNLRQLQKFVADVVEA